MKAFITGTRGFIGGHLQAYLIAHGVEVMSQLSEDVEIIFSIASGSEVSESLDRPRAFIRNNVDLILDLLETARILPNLKNFIHLSTSEVYGPCRRGEDHAEWSPIVTHSPYSASKAAQEAILMSYWKSFGVPVTIVNTMNVFGERQQKHKLLPTLVRQILCNKKIKLTGSEEEPTLRKYIHADTLADALLFIAERIYFTSEWRPRRLNVAGEKEFSLLELSTRVANLLAKDFSHYYVEASRPGHGGRYSLDNKNIHAMGWVEPESFDDSLKRTVAHLASFEKASAGASIGRGATQVESASGGLATPAPPSIIPE